MAVTEEFRLDVLEVLDEYTAALENQTGNNSVPIMAEDEIDETVSMPALKYSANPLENSRAVPEGYRQVPFVTFWNRIDKLSAKVEESTADLDVLHNATAAARDAANEAAQAANQSREAIERNEQTRQTNENNRQQAESLRQQTFETNEQQRQQDFEDAEAERIAAMLMTECYVDFDTMCLMFVQPEKDTTDYNVVDGDLMITVQYEEE